MIGTGQHGISTHADDSLRRHHGLASAAGISLTELLMSVTLFSITVVGAVGAINAIDNVSQYGTSTGNPLMQVLSRAGVDFWFLQTKPNDADGGKSLKLTKGETDAVRYRMATAKVCP